MVGGISQCVGLDDVGLEDRLGSPTKAGETTCVFRSLSRCELTMARRRSRDSATLSALMSMP